MSDRRLYTGRCIGGPMDGQNGASRFPEGFVLHDADNGIFLGTYVCRGEIGHEEFVWRTAVDSRLEIARAVETANGNAYDVRAFDPLTMGEAT